MEVAAPGWRGVRTPVLVAGVLLAASIALHLRDPHRSGSYGFCPWLALTGTYCPGCGGLRAVNDLTHFNVLAAASSNLLLVASLPFVALWWLRSFVDGWRGVRRHLSDRSAYVVLVVVLASTMVFWVVRNLPFASWLTP
ncbi:MAG TPA: DUF2752 domain-containing protein [Nocardioides sp.]|uniref:DUF2752 domain-containing protein n=1 Tax=Nocardioides sp. TaxID=35761 RepID=UPI002D80054E|nr:DUF2752 domain-containing protein [Nocardioides sp.]HET6651531.1 DUF2752 domain-containing protein [Nocardioides sp.]